MFKTIETVSRGRSGSVHGNYGVIYVGKHKVFSLTLSESILKKAKIVIGDHVTFSLAEAKDKTKWLVVESDNGGYKVSCISQVRGKPTVYDGTYRKAAIKTTRVDGFLSKYFSETGKRWDDNDAEVTTGMIAFPLETKRTWF